MVPSYIPTAACPMDVTEGAILMVVRLQHLLNAHSQIDITDVDMSTDFKFLHPEKAPYPIFVTVSGNVTDTTCVQSLKASSATSVVPCGIWTWSSIAFSSSLLVMYTWLEPFGVAMVELLSRDLCWESRKVLKKEELDTQQTPLLWMMSVDPNNTLTCSNRGRRNKWSEKNSAPPATVFCDWERKNNSLLFKRKIQRINLELIHL